MTSKRFEIILIARVVLLFITLCGAAWLFVKYQTWYPIVLLVIAFFQLFAIIKYVNRINTELRDFINAIKYKDFSQHYSVQKAPASVALLRQAFNDVGRAFNLLNIEKETQYRYLQTVMEIVDTGILLFDEDGTVKWVNEAAKKMFSLPELKNIEGLKSRNTELKEILESLKPGENKLLEIETGHFPIKIVSSTMQFRLNGKIQSMFVFKNVNDAVQETEMQTWQKLLRTITHEIMNSVAPIASLAETLKKRLSYIQTDGGFETSDNEAIEDIELMVDVIRKRSEGLLKFAETYRSLSKITIPSLSVINIQDLFANLNQLLGPDLKQKGIKISTELRDHGLKIEVDISLIEQVLINLILNATEAVKERENPQIKLVSFLNEANHIVIEVIDNGIGIPQELRDQIFIPFFTTRKNGSGIGLSLSRQIMQLHKGTIVVDSREGEGSIFRLIF
ncbi:ATP-binding protein [Solitalea sp. MAHUQ-68]|uniref:histidine kinase n=1 Tax=Solitalea agri TaxID=2953739 RepID=A0A9X2F0F3_9SPHI|nr:ATP-binding protein [Solitalea agri]MCO4291844.1 ATP-binding protein [Solitalea agri]